VQTHTHSRRTSIRALLAGLVLAAVGLAPGRLLAQETRASIIAEAQAAKAEQLTSYVPSKGERIAADIKRRVLQTPNGFYPWFDSVYSGGGFTLGAGYRRFYGDRTFWVARGLFSAKAYKLAEVGTMSLGLAGGHIDLRVLGGWRDATQVAFYGVGGTTAPDGKTDFRLKQAYAGALVRGRSGLAVFDLGTQFEDYTLESGHGTGPSIEDVHTPATAPGLGANPVYIHVTASGGMDSRTPSPGYARRGGLYALTYDGYFDTNETYTFDRLQAEAVQHIPILRENWVVSLHAVARTTLDDGDTVPYFLLPALGSGSTLRAYPSWRFRDRHSLLLSGEWRWLPNRMFLDLALFADAGKVASRREDLNFSGLKHDVGVGMRIHGLGGTPLRIDVAHGSEGFNIVFSGSPAF
jgi:hypothetical protein